jgi:hypothetical protein
MKHLLLITVACAVLMTPGTLHAHHVVSESGIAWVEPMSVAQVDATSARFDLGPTWQGRWWSVAPMVELTPIKRLSVIARVPMVRIDFDDGRAVMGLGDISTSLKVLCWADEHGKLIVSAGLGVELPTGSARDALGSGHLELVPFVAGSSQIARRVILSGILSERLSLGEESSGGSPLAVHEAHELFARVMGTWTSLGPLGLYGSAGLDRVVVWSGGVRGPLTARAELGLVQRQTWRLAWRSELPLAGQRRHKWLTGLNLALWF